MTPRPRQLGRALGLPLLLGLAACAAPADGTSGALDGGRLSVGSGDAAATDVDAADATDAAALDAPDVDRAVPDGITTDVAAPDAAPSDDAGPDGAAADATDGDTQAPDSAGQDGDAGPKQTAWGQISGACGAVAAELSKPTPSFLVATYAFSSGPAFDPSALDAGAKKRYQGPNAGGSSKCSEVMTMQLLVDCEGGSDLLTEVELEYTKTDTSITDFALKISGQQVGVSVTRAYLGPKVTTYTEADATKLLTKKLAGILESSQYIAPKYKWVKQVLAVWTLQASWVPTVEAAWLKIDPALRADTVILAVVEQGPGWIVPEKCLGP